MGFVRKTTGVQASIDAAVRAQEAAQGVYWDHQMRMYRDTGTNALRDILSPREPVVKTSKGCPNCGAPFEPVCSYCKTVNNHATSNQ